MGDKIDRGLNDPEYDTARKNTPLEYKPIIQKEKFGKMP